MNTSIPQNSMYGNIFEDGIANKTVQCGISSAFHNKSIRDGYDKRAYGNSFKPTAITIDALVEHLTNGGAYTLSCFTGTSRTKKTFKNAQLLGLDFDDDISVQDCLNHPFIAQNAFFIGATATSGVPDENGIAKSKTRVLFLVGELITDLKKFERYQHALQLHIADLHPDPAPKDSSRLFYGSDNPDYVVRDNILSIATLEGIVDQWHDVLDDTRPRTDDENAQIREYNRQAISTVTDDRQKRYLKYAQTALDNLAHDLATTTQGGRNTKLYQYGAKMGNMISAGMIDYLEVETALYNAGLSSGLSQKEIIQTLPRAIHDGENTPHDLSKLDNSYNSYKSQVKDSSLKDRIQCVTLPALTDGHVVNVSYVSDIGFDIFDKQRLIIIRSGMGTGKTEMIKRHIARMPDTSRVIGISPFEQLSEATAATMGMDSYKDIPREHLANTPQLAICAKSLPKLINDEGTAHNRNLTFIDEVDQLLQQLISGIYKNAEALETLAALQMLLKVSNQVIATSAHITDIEVKILEQLTGKTAYVIDNQFTRDMPDVKLHKDYHKLIDTALKIAQKADTPVFIPCGSLSTARVVQSLAYEVYGIPEDEIFMLTSRNSHTEAARQLASDPNTHIPRYKLFIYTFAVGVGMDYTGDCAGVFGVFDNRNMTPAQDIQMMERARYATQYHAYVQPGVMTLETDSQEIKGRVTRNAKRTATLTNIKNISDTIPQRQHLSIGSKYQAQRNLIRTDKLSYFVAYAKAQGHKVAFNDLVADKILKALFTEARDTIKAYDKHMTLSNVWVESHEFDNLRSNGELEDRHFYGRTRDKIEQCTGQLITDESYDHFHTSQKRRALMTFTDYISPQAAIYGNDQLEVANGVPLLNRSNYGLRQRWIRRFIKALGGGGTQADCLKALTGNQVTRDTLIDRIQPLFDDHLQELKDIFQWRKDLSNDRLALIRWLLSRISLKLVSKQVMVDGERFRLYWLCPETLDVMKQYAVGRRDHLQTIGTDENPLLKTRNTYLLIRDLSNTDLQKQISMEYEARQAQIEAIPI